MSIVTYLSDTQLITNGDKVLRRLPKLNHNAPPDTNVVRKQKSYCNSGHELLSLLFRFAHKILSTLDPGSRFVAF